MAPYLSLCAVLSPYLHCLSRSGGCALPRGLMPGTEAVSSSRVQWATTQGRGLLCARYKTPAANRTPTLSNRLSMRGFTSYLVAALAALSLLGENVYATAIPRVEGDKRYIVLLKEETNRRTHMAWVDGQRAKITAGSLSVLSVTSSYNALNGYTAHLSDDRVAQLSKSPDVAMVVEDQRCEGYRGLKQTDAPWGISRVSRKTKLRRGSKVDKLNYVFERKPSGAGVDVYVLDTGVNTQHVDFGGRAGWGATFGPYNDTDGHGHGTHIAGTIAGKRFGVAKAASIVAVKVLGDDNSGWNTAGNSNRDAKDFSPARVPDVITVGATNIQDGRWVTSASVGSNYGPIVDVFAPGQDITSAWIGSDTATKRLTGTSMATPHVAGLVAYLLAVEGRRTPANMMTRIKQLAPDRLLSGIPPGTPNEIIWNGGV
ncbi:Serine protease [Rhizoctonia solani]|uniref:Serine protease n=1 Tax=Rhizoctonia solani TaxID=456999 RepID=A0A8H8NV70_9AGAM|nr:Serine protease [Rhizoctonia solani]QRW20110.1 Serine protease [Rhizoctonia solani]